MKTLFAVLTTVLVMAGAPSAQADKQAETKDPFAALKYRLIGPYAGGRVSRVAGVPGDPSTYYAATANGGVWKSVNGGTVWQPVFDSQPISSIGSIAVAPGDPNVVYVGSGEANIRGNVAASRLGEAVAHTPLPSDGHSSDATAPRGCPVRRTEQ